MIKSQDDLNTCNDRHRSSEVLLATIEKLEQTQKKLDMAIKCLERYADHENWQDECAGANDCLFLYDYGYRFARETLEQIRELEKWE